ncbi:glutaredoxin domain-containing protein [Arthrobacter sp. IK3]|uniref:glutaredoxin domain-containing protein n=1 Tax=Arthrobacter sp. IK3 TaxID=3448169 RepID=UPI003EE2CB69
MSQKTVTVYSKPSGCQQCIAMKRALEKTDVYYVVLDATADEHKAFLDTLGYMQAPVTVVHDAEGNRVDDFFGFRPDKVAELAADPAVRRREAVAA